MTISILVGDVRERLREIPTDSIHCCVTSPPYWGLRDYETEGQIGLESSPEEFIAVMVAVFEEVRRVLRPDGTCWVNMGDSYVTSGGAPTTTVKPRAPAGWTNRAQNFRTKAGGSLKPKDLCMMPHRLAIALQDAGWWVRQDIVWHKPNPMPESIKDRCTKAHEYIFLLTKSERYFYDAEAIKEQAVGDTEHPRNRFDTKDYAVPGQKPQKRLARGVGFGHGTDARERARGRVTVKVPDGWDRSAGQGEYQTMVDTGTRNRRSVWTMATHSFKEAHFATFPPELPETCIKAGCPPGGTVLDPFLGSGTTLMVADRLQRNGIGIELNPIYAEMARQRIGKDAPLLTRVEVSAAPPQPEERVEEPIDSDSTELIVLDA